MQKGKTVVRGGLTKSWEKKRSKRQRRKGKIYPSEFRVLKKTFLSDQCKYIEENYRMGKTRDLFKKIRDTKWSEVAQSCLTLCKPVDCSLPGSSVYGILQARILEWVTISFSRGSSQPRDQTRVSHIGDRCFNLWATREAQRYQENKHFVQRWTQ